MHLCHLVLLGALGAAEAPASEVLTWNSDWRVFVMCRPPRYVTPVVDRRGRTHEFIDYPPGWHVAFMRGRIATPPPPGEWVRPGFDDHDWQRERRPDAGEHEWTPVVALKCLRGRFLVPDPGAVRRLAISMEYIGGVAVYLNGREVARQHLPAGDLQPDTPAEAYGERAYQDEQGTLLGSLHRTTYSERRPTPEVLAARYRRLEADLPMAALVRGVNVLAVEVHRSDYHQLAAQWRWTCGGMGGNIAYWSHIGVERLAVTVTPGDAAVGRAPPADLDLWVEDIHRRLTSRSEPEVGEAAEAIRMVGVRNGTFSGQAVVRGRTTLEGPTAAVSDLAGPEGTRIPSAAIAVRYAVPRPYREMAVLLSEGRGWNEILPMRRAIDSYVPDAQTWAERLAAWDRLRYFDHLTDDAPDTVPAGEAQPIWLSVAVPRDARPGTYHGTLTVRAGSLGRTLPVRLEVIDWDLPDRQAGSLFVGLHHSPYPVALHYGVAPWSDRHWALEAQSLRLLGHLGNGLVMLPVTSNVYQETGAKESIVPWLRKRDGTYAFDTATLERYLDLLIREMGRPRAVVCVVAVGPTHHRGLAAPTVTMIDEATGERTDLVLPAYDAPEAEQLWRPYVAALTAVMERKGLMDAMTWGIFYDDGGTEVQKATTLLARLAPAVGWMRSSHQGGPLPEGRGRVALDIRLRGFEQPFAGDGSVVSRRGWSDPAGAILFPRSASSVRALQPYDSLWAFRTTMEWAVVNGAAGVARIGADNWPPFAFGEWFMPMVPAILYPGRDGAESSATFEVFREGLQETEARVALERWLEGQGAAKADEGSGAAVVAGGAAVDEAVRALLDERVVRMGAVPTGPAYTPIGGYYGGWQGRSHALFDAAARACRGKGTARRSSQWPATSGQ